MEKKLNILERMVLLGLLPQEGNFATLKLMRKLRESLSLTDQEIKEYDFKQEGDRLSWKPELAHKEKAIDFEDFALELIKTELRKLNDSKKLEDKHFSLYEKFIEG